MADQARSGRLAELTIALSLSTDLGTGQPMEHGLRTCWLSVAVSTALGLEASTQSCVYYAALLRFVGCTSNASETAVLAGGNDVALNAAVAPMLTAQPAEGVHQICPPGLHGRSAAGDEPTDAQALLAASRRGVIRRAE
jgi:hypothetical protein